MRGLSAAAMPGARVTLLDSRGRITAETTADVNGRYRFADVPEGDYTIRATAPPPTEQNLRVAGGRLHEADLPLLFSDNDHVR